MVGAHLLYKLLMQQREVRALLRDGSKLDEVRRIFSFYGDDAVNLMDRIEWVRGDVSDYYSVVDALAGVEKVFHCAGYVNFDPRFRKQMYQINEEGTANVVNACLEMHVSKICYVSSIATLGSSLNGNLTNEMDAWQENESHSHYSISKFRAEMEIWRGIREGVPAVIVNPGVIIGPGSPARSSGLLFDAARKGMKYYTSGGTGYVDVRDVVDAMIRLMDSDIVDERYVLVSANKSFHWALTSICNALGVNEPSKLASARLTSFAWRLDAVRAFFTQTPPRFTRENARTSHSVSNYSAEKFITAFNYQFIPIEQSIVDAAGWMKREYRW